MATLKEYFDTDPRALTIHGNWSFGAVDGSSQDQVIAKIAYDFESNAEYWYFYVPPISDLSGFLGARFGSSDFEVLRG
jgi:hypothetical protein